VSGRPTPVNQLKKIVFFSLRLAWALVVLVAVCIVWLVLFLFFLPFVLIISLIAVRSDSSQQSEALSHGSVSPEQENESSEPLIFDRRRDISKLFGCNTRNVQYRWNVFASRLEQIRKDFATPNALDFGAGSLRDSYELARLGFCVTSVDLDPSVMQRYYRSYDWTVVRCPPRVFTDSIEKLRDESRDSGFHLAIAFDVIEHLEDPSRYCRSIHSLLNEGGLFFSIVPNRRSIFERYFRYTMTKQRAKGIPFVPGVPHLQFKLPSEWEELFEQSGFRILEHDMAIGFFVNDLWTGLLGLPLRVYVAPVLARLAGMLRLGFDQVAFEEAFSPPWLMKRVDVLDQLFKKQLASRFGWNLIVATK
jgi:2-polyprenyl-3-methyl-5-hydroxy-6-metoxy-1,4-benzoquinol methylase